MRAFPNILAACYGSEQRRIEFNADTVEGPAAAAILRVARTESCDLIVMGSPGLGMVRDLLPGRVSYRVQHHAAIPVRIVH